MSPATALALQRPASPGIDAHRFNSYLLHIPFEAPGGERRAAVGGGESVPDAIASARAELPAGTWTLTRWNPLYGE